MDLKDILNKLDSIQEAEIDPAQLAVQEKQRFAN